MCIEYSKNKYIFITHYVMNILKGNIFSYPSTVFGWNIQLTLEYWSIINKYFKFESIITEDFYRTKVAF